NCIGRREWIFGALQESGDGSSNRHVSAMNVGAARAPHDSEEPHIKRLRHSVSTLQVKVFQVHGIDAKASIASLGELGALNRKINREAYVNIVIPSFLFEGHQDIPAIPARRRVASGQAQIRFARFSSLMGPSPATRRATCR